MVMGVPGEGFELVTLRDGSRSIRSNTHGETMHIGSNPGTEALELHVRQQRIVERVAAASAREPFVIWDIGLGPGGNAIAAIRELTSVERPVEIHSFEISTDVMEFALLNAGVLGYLAPWKGVVGQLLEEGLAFPHPLIRWQLHRGDFSRMPEGIPPVLPAPSAIFFDPYSPNRNPEMWSLGAFRSIWRAVSAPGAPPCTMTSYTRSTSARVTMMLAGWFVGSGVPTGEKEETTLAANNPGLLERPLGGAWIRRVKASTNSAPLNGEISGKLPISREDFQTLISHPQFRDLGQAFLETEGRDFREP